MVLFLAINTSNVALAPLGVIGLRAALGSSNAAGIWIPTLLATLFSTVVGICAAKLLQRMVKPVEEYAAEEVAFDRVEVVEPTEERGTGANSIVNAEWFRGVARRNWDLSRIFLRPYCLARRVSGPRHRHPVRSL